MSSKNTTVNKAINLNNTDEIISFLNKIFIIFIKK